jgi:ATP adenylyltransferase
MKNCHSFQTKFATEAYAESRELWDTPIFESRSFVALPTVGALVEGWLLVVPRVAELSLARLSTSLISELGEFLEGIVPALESAYGPVSVFEHGPAISNSSVGCGVDYAHLHLVPTRFDLLAGARKVAPNIRWDQFVSFDEIHKCASLVDGYWFLKQNYRSNSCYLGTCEYGPPTSQLFRKVIANYLGRPSLFDWKIAPGESMIAATVENLNQRTILA